MNIPEIHPVDVVVNMLNEMVQLDPRAWALFDVMVPCAPIVGRTTPIELMGVHPRLAMVGTLGVLNGALRDPSCRISIVTENKDGIAQRKFARTSAVPVISRASIQEPTASAAQGPDTTRDAE